MCNTISYNISVRLVARCKEFDRRVEQQVNPLTAGSTIRAHKKAMRGEEWKLVEPGQSFSSVTGTVAISNGFFSVHVLSYRAGEKGRLKEKQDYLFGATEKQIGKIALPGF